MSTGQAGDIGASVRLCASDRSPVLVRSGDGSSASLCAPLGRDPVKRVEHRGRAVR
jgi:hypothetical protein